VCSLRIAQWGFLGLFFCFLLSFFVVFLVSFLYHGSIASQAEEETKEEADIRKAIALSMIPGLLYIII
jgi:amino acid permease